MTQFDHEKLEVYQLSLIFAKSADEIAFDLAAKRTTLADQLRRAAFSIALNIAEGAGEFRLKEKARIYRIAARSGNECAAILDISEVIQAIDQARQVSGKELLVRIVSMLIRLCMSLEAKAQRDGRQEEESGTGTGTGTGTGKKDGNEAGTGMGRKPR